MALVKCPDCGTEISSSAPACPKCGRPMGSGAVVSGKGEGCFLRTLNVGCFVVILFVAIIIFAVATTGSK